MTYCYLYTIPINFRFTDFCYIANISIWPKYYSIKLSYGYHQWVIYFVNIFVTNFIKFEFVSYYNMPTFINIVFRVQTLLLIAIIFSDVVFISFFMIIALGILVLCRKLLFYYLFVICCHRNMYLVYQLLISIFYVFIIIYLIISQWDSVDGNIRFFIIRQHLMGV